MTAPNQTTIKTIAEKLGIAKSTVSKALKDSYEISAATKNKVLEAAHELNYRPNHFASGLKSRKSKTIAVIVPDIVDSFFALAIKGIEAETQKRGFHINIYITNDLLRKEDEIVKMLADGRIDGVLISVCRETSDSSHLKGLINNGIPVVFFDRAADDIDTGKVTTNDFEAGYIAARHLLEQGCKKVCFLSTSEGLSISQKRTEGFARALRENNIGNPQNNVYQISTEETKCVEALKLLLSNRKERPDGLILSVELLINPIYITCQLMGINIPGDLKIICFSNLQYAPLLSPPLSTITQPAFEIGEQAASLICGAIINNRSLKNEKIVCPSKLDIRNSSLVAMTGLDTRNY